MKIKLSKKDWQTIGCKAGWIKQAAEQLDLFESNEPPSSLENPVVEEIEEEKAPKTKASPYLISAWREATGQYIVFFGTPSGKYYVYELGAYRGKNKTLGASEVQDWIKKLDSKPETKQQAMRVAEKSAIWAVETDANKNFIKDVDLTSRR